MSKLFEINQQIQHLQKQAGEIKAKEFDSTVADIMATMQAFGITVKDLVPGKRRGAKGKAGVPAKSAKSAKAIKAKPVVVVAPKYRGPAGETWSGRGLMPRWMKSLIDAGQSKSEFEISTDLAPAAAADKT